VFNLYSDVFNQGELFALVTDQGFLNEANVVWETQSNVEGDGHFVDANFHTYRLPEMNTDICKTAAAAQSIPCVPPPVNSKEQIDHE
jgi:ubiquitin carboxyl-terminal hydrolase MINDY-1/2